MLLHLGPNVITFRTLLHLGQLLHLGLQQMLPQILPESAKLPSQNKRFCDNFLLGLWLTACAL